MTDHPTLKPEDRALIEPNVAGLSAENAALVNVTGLTLRSGQGAGFYVPAHILGHLLDAARTEGRRSGEGGDVVWFQWNEPWSTWEQVAQEHGGEPGTVAFQRAAPPVEAKPAEGDREAVARIIDPDAWATRDRQFGEIERSTRIHDKDKPMARFSANGYVHRSLTKADDILSLIPARDEAALPEPVAWRFRSPEYGGTAPRWTYEDREPKFHPSRGYTVEPLYAHPATGTDELPADVVRLVKALRPVMPITTRETPDYAEVTFGDHQSQAMTMDPKTWEEITDAFAPFASRVPHESGGGHG